jgi:hypothetical protein
MRILVELSLTVWTRQIYTTMKSFNQLNFPTAIGSVFDLHCRKKNLEMPCNNMLRKVRDAFTTDLIHDLKQLRF